MATTQSQQPTLRGLTIVNNRNLLHQPPAALHDLLDSLHGFVSNLNFPALEAFEARYVPDYDKAPLELYGEDRRTFDHRTLAVEAFHDYRPFLVLMSGINVEASGLYAVTCTEIGEKRARQGARDQKAYTACWRALATDADPCLWQPGPLSRPHIIPRHPCKQNEY